LEGLESVRLEVVFTGDNGVDSKLLTGVLQAAERARKKATAELLTRAQVALELDPVAVDAARHRLRNVDFGGFRLTGTRQGSLIADLGVVALAYWLLKTTIGASVKEAWTQTDSHKKLVEWLSRDLDADAQRMGEHLKRETRRLAQRATFVVSLRYEAEILVVSVEITDLLADDRPPLVAEVRPNR